MQKVVTRGIAGTAIPIAIAAGSALITAAPASAHDGPEPVGNAGDAVHYTTEHVQGRHLNEPMFGLGSTIDDPYGDFESHVVPYTLNTLSLALTGHNTDGSKYGEEEEAPEHDH